MNGGVDAKKKLIGIFWTSAAAPNVCIVVVGAFRRSGVAGGRYAASKFVYWRYHDASAAAYFHRRPECWRG